MKRSSIRKYSRSSEGLLTLIEKRKAGFCSQVQAPPPHIGKEITESLAGRIATVEMWPFKQGEFYEKEISGLYSLMSHESPRAKDFLQFQSLFPRLNIHNFRRFLSLMAQFSGHQLNMSDMARALEISVSTIKDYLDILHQTFVWRNLEP